MKVQLTVYYTDDSSGVLEMEKRPGYHPDSVGVLAQGVLVAEKTGKKVAKIGRSKVNPFSTKDHLVVVDNLRTRQQVLDDLSSKVQPMAEEYKPLYLR